MTGDPARSRSLIRGLVAGLSAVLAAACAGTGTSTPSSEAGGSGRLAAAPAPRASAGPGAPPPALIGPGERPDSSSVEAGLWLLSDRTERAVLGSGRIVTDADLNAYVRGIVCRLSPTHCPDIRIAIVRVPHFNASMMANGFMQVWTGLLLRAENEAQLAFVLGHELAHYLQRHTIERWETVRSTSSLTTFIQIATAAAGVGYVGSLAQLAALGGILAFGRDQEREADAVGMRLLQRAGYDGREAPRIWQALKSEAEADEDDEPSIFFSTHPSTDERIEELRAMAVALHSAGERLSAAYERAVQFHRADWLRDDIQLRRFARTEVMLERLGENVAGDRGRAEVRYFQGELYRLRGAEGDAERARDAYRAAITTGSAPASTHRSLALIHRRLGDDAAARAEFRRYLELAPDAPDRAIVRSYLD